MDQIEQAYTVLELEPGASMFQVNQSYKDLVFIWHPDRIPSDRERLKEKAEAKLKQLNEARSFLRSQSRNGKMPTSRKGRSSGSSSGSSSDQSAAASNYPRNSRSAAYSSGYYRPGDDSTYRPYSRTASAHSTTGNGTTGNGSSRAGGYRPPYEAYRKAASSTYDDSYSTSAYPSSHWPRQEQTSSQPNSYKGGQAATNTSSHTPQAKPGDISQKSADSTPARSKRDSDLSGADMRGANLKEKDFSGRNLSNANLAGADLSDTFMHKVNLNRANLRKARLFRANLLQADLSHADLSGADLIGADLSGADLSGADLSGAKVGYGDKIMVKLLGARLTGTIMPNGRIHE